MAVEFFTICTGKAAKTSTVWGEVRTVLGKLLEKCTHLLTKKVTTSPAKWCMATYLYVTFDAKL